MNSNNKNTQYLGNNGKFEKFVDAIEVTTNAVWAEDDNHTETTLYVYVKENNVLTPLLKDGEQYRIHLTSENNWQDTTYLPTPTGAQTYYLMQNMISGYRTSYTNSENLLLNNKTTKMGKLIINNKQANLTITNLYGCELPNTGGPGTVLIYVLGVLILLSSIISIIKKNTY